VRAVMERCLYSHGSLSSTLTWAGSAGWNSEETWQEDRLHSGQEACSW
jgi:hypothetical protein